MGQQGKKGEIVRVRATVAAVAMVAATLVASGAPATAQTPRCFGRDATIVATPGVPTVGTSGPDVIVGTSGPDIIQGGGGDDRICALRGDDDVSGGRGDDRIKLGGGADTAKGGGGADRIWGNGGPDTISGGGGADQIRGGGGADIISGGGQGDDLRGGGGGDTVAGNRGNDTIDGGNGFDQCNGGSGTDSLRSCNEELPGIGAGTWRVGTDIQPGRYESTVTGFCYWERLSGFSGESDDRIANGIASSGERLLVDIDPTDAGFEVRAGCGPLRPYRAPAEPDNRIGAGLWVVGADIAPGRYASNAGEGCFWARLSDFGGARSTLANHFQFFDGPIIVDVLPTDVGIDVDADCGTLRPYRAPDDPPATRIEPGMWLVGTDIEPGTYRTTAAEGCYWERLSGFSGDSDDRIANNFVEGPTIVEIDATDIGFSTDGDCGTWRRA